MIGLIRIVGIRFKRAGKIYYFDPGDMELEHGDQVVVETASGLEFGDVVVPPKSVPEDEVVQPIRKVVRQVGSDDHEQLVINRRDERAAQAIAVERIEAHGLPMKLVNTEYTFDRNRLTFFFTADNRVDFRALVHDLAKQFGVRIELRQIGVRDEAKEVGGIGVCGRELCCTSWMGEFAPVSIRMAKQQQLSLNPSKLTGQCGRLKCCLKFENDTYRQVRALLPEPGDKIAIAAGAAQVAGEAVSAVASEVLSMASGGETMAVRAGSRADGTATVPVVEGAVREVLITRESVLVDIGEGKRVHVSLKQIESGEAVVLTGKLARTGPGGADVDDSRQRTPGHSQAAAETMRAAEAEGAAAAETAPDSPERPAAQPKNAEAGNEQADRPRKRRRSLRRRSRRRRDTAE